MLKKILSLTLCLCICFGVVFSATSCGSSKDSKPSSSSTARVPTTLSFLGITSEVTDQKNVEMVEEALNEIFAARFKTKIDLTLVTEDEYMALVEERIQLAEEYKLYDAAIAQYNSYIKKQANTNTTTDKIFGNWISGGVEISLETLATRLVYVSEQTIVHEDGRVETLYPEAPSPVDIVMIVDEKMYDDFTEMGLLLDKNIDSTLTSYKNLQKYIYPTFFTELKNLKKYVNAIPNNNMLAESTYLVVKKDLATKYNFDIEGFRDYDDLAGFLANVKANEQIVPFKNIPEALGVFTLFSEDIAVGAYLDPLVGYNPEEGEQYGKYEIKNLFEIKEYTDHLELMETYRELGYFSRDAYANNGYAVEVIKGDASIAARYEVENPEYIVKEIQIPFVLREAIFDGMLAPTAYTSDMTRAMEIIEAINTDSEVKNLLQYGIEEYNYIPNTETGSIIQLNESYIMDNALTGNAYVGYVPYEPDAEKVTAWKYVMKTNLAAVSSPFLIFPVDEAYLKSNLANILNRAGLAEALSKLDPAISYEEYANPKSPAIGSANQKALRTFYKDYLVEQALEQGKVDKNSEGAKDKAIKFVETTDIAWVEETVAQIYVGEKYSKVATEAQIDALVSTKLSEGIVGEAAIYESARKNAQKYLENIEFLKVIAKETIFADMSDAEYEQKYGSLSVLAYEKAVYNYLKENYEKENNLTEEDYLTLVHNFIATNFKFTDPSTKQQYTYSWDEFIAIKEKAMEFSAALQKAKAQYSALITEVGGASQSKIDSWDDVTLADNILSTIKKAYYNSLNTSEKEFEEYVYNEYILKTFNLTRKELEILRVKDNALYKDYLKKIKKQYKSQLLETYTKSEYEVMSDTAALTAVYEYYIEYFTKAQESLCDVMGYSKKEYAEYYDYADKYVECVNTKMKKSFIYTLQTRYTQAEIDAMSVAQAEKAVIDLVYESGYYMNELAKCIGIELSDYNFNKSSAIEYLGDPDNLEAKPGYLNKLIERYATGFAEKGYTLDQAKALAPEKVEEIVREIIREKDFADYRTIDVELTTLCKNYLDIIEDYAIDNDEYKMIADILGVKESELKDRYGAEIKMNEFIEIARETLSANYFFSAVEGYLNGELQVKIAD